MVDLGEININVQQQGETGNLGDLAPGKNGDGDGGMNLPSSGGGKKGGMGGMSKIMGTIAGLIGTIVSISTSILALIGAALGILAILLSLEPIQKMLDAFMKIIQAFFMPLAMMLMTLFAPVLKGLVKLLPLWYNFLKSPWKGLKKLFKTLFEIGTGIDISKLKNAGSKIISAAGSALSLLKSGLAGLGKWIAGGLSGAVTWIRKKFGGLISWLKSKFNGLIQGLTGMIPSVGGGIGGAIGNIGNIGGGLIGDLTNLLTGNNQRNRKTREQTQVGVNITGDIAEFLRLGATNPDVAGGQ